MANELKYKISFASDRSGLDAAAGAMRGLDAGSRTAAGGLDSLGVKSAYASQAMMGVQQAAQGDIGAVMGLARAVRALWMAFAAGSGPIGVIILALMAVYKVLTHFTEKYNESAKASLEAADKTQKFSEALKTLRARAADVAIAFDAEKKSLEDIGKWYDSASQAAVKFSEAQKKVIDADKAAALSKVEEQESAGLLGAGKDQAAINKITEEATRWRLAIEDSARTKSLKSDEDALIARKRLNAIMTGDLEKQLATAGPSEGIIAQKARIADLKEHRDAIRAATPDVIGTGKLTPKLYARNLAGQALGSGGEIIKEEDTVTTENVEARNKALEKSRAEYLNIFEEITAQNKLLEAEKVKNDERVAKIKEELQVKRDIGQAIDKELATIPLLQSAAENTRKAAADRLALQEKINAENAEDLALTAQKKALEKSLAAAQVTGAKALADAKKKEETLTTQAAAAKKRVETGDLSPEETIAEAKRKAARGIRSPEITAILARQKEILAGEDPKEIIAREKAVARAREASQRLRGVGRPGLLDKERPMTSAERKIAAILGAEKLRVAAAGATAARAAMELKQAGDIAGIRTAIESVDKKFDKTLQFS